MHQLVLIGMKSSGKTTVGQLLAEQLGLTFVDLDAEIERSYEAERQLALSFREIFRAHGAEHFRALEAATLERLAVELRDRPCVLSTGGGTPLHAPNQPRLRQLGRVIFLDVAEEVLLPRIVEHGIPAFFPYPGDPARSLRELLAARRPVYSGLADLVLAVGAAEPQAIAAEIVARLGHG